MVFFIKKCPHLITTSTHLFTQTGFVMLAALLQGSWDMRVSS